MARGRRQGLLTILFTDIEASTAMTQRLGDARAQEIVRAHNTIVRREVQARGGTEVKHTGDGIMATFPSAARAVAAAIAIEQASLTYNDAHPETAFRVSIGLNAGEPVAEDADVFGTAVQMAARACAEAGGGQILATNVVRELVYGKGALFDDIGATTLKGFDEPVHLYAVGVGAAGIDEGAAGGRNLVLPLAVGAIAAITVAVAAGAFFLIDGGSEGERVASTSAYRELRFDANYDVVLALVGGTCETNDLRFNATATGRFTGEIAGSYTGRVNVLLGNGCQSLELDTYETAEDEAGNRLEARTVSISLPRIGTLTGEVNAGTTSEVRTVGVITDSAGIYAGASGTWDCALISTQQPDGHALLDGECVVLLTVDAPAPAELAVSASRERLGVSANSRAEPDTVEMRGVYVTNGSPLTGMTMRLIAPAGVELTVEGANPAGSDPRNQLGWDLPADDAGKPVLFSATARLRSSDVDQFNIYVEIDANELEQPIRSSPIPFSVVR